MRSTDRLEPPIPWPKTRGADQDCLVPLAPQRRHQFLYVDGLTVARCETMMEKVRIG